MLTTTRYRASTGWDGSKGRSASSYNPPVSLAAGTRLGSYEVLSSVGAGGMGEVYRAFDPSPTNRARLEKTADGVPSFTVFTNEAAWTNFRFGPP